LTENYGRKFKINGQLVKLVCGCGITESGAEGNNM